ncbi:MAG: isoprenyl transferase [Candidatus Omnitrophica bacterium CG07_land_8_20_14_0_80_42_15]|uniref:Isoprenyl transferase n=1 Tax=Candidatus Aquitaenariimonas noxiae TaxID=1974741 RepID=A0A2J0L3J8_9BACT|nr:MAG: isoprenyl transferase [Candidatus Omnitrophica bacterium CG07_land_8_20_14_0_80_42_15]
MDAGKLPVHVAMIMDGNGRWARKKRLPKILGHQAGVESIRRVIEAAQEMGIKILTLYAFSTENWSRPRNEVKGLMRLLERYLDNERDKLLKHNIRFNVIGNIDNFPAAVKQKLYDTIEVTKNNTSLMLNLALGYGARTEILEAVKQIAQDLRDKKVKIPDLDENLFSSYLYTKGIPDPDLLIRTSGEMRVSNFLLWQISYTELYIAKKLWPDFKKEDFKRAVETFMARERRFGR